ncbi:helix-turn-helix transcriptional regulator [Haloarchaeobius sp. DFWS5]|uniref:helix-turn-helix transcriptional regulator n=1 Tax=Haloarchaeobius sp. DFWS5 TaxID=3446114 RepID=UPI003EB8ABC3
MNALFRTVSKPRHVQLRQHRPVLLRADAIESNELVHARLAKRRTQQTTWRPRAAVILGQVRHVVHPQAMLNDRLSLIASRARTTHSRHSTNTMSQTTDTTRKEPTDHQQILADGGVAWSDLTGFQRDLLDSIYRMESDGETPYGLAIKDELDDFYAEDINHGRLYSNLDALYNLALIEKTELDKRTYEYTLNDESRELVENRTRHLADTCGWTVRETATDGGREYAGTLTADEHRLYLPEKYIEAPNLVVRLRYVTSDMRGCDGEDYAIRTRTSDDEDRNPTNPELDQNEALLKIYGEEPELYRVEEVATDGGHERERLADAAERQADALEDVADMLSYQNSLLTHLAEQWTAGGWTDEAFVGEAARFEREFDDRHPFFTDGGEN